MSTINAQIHIKDSNGTLCDVQPKTTIANVSGLQTALDGKVNTVSGKGLSSNDYTTTEKNKLAGIASGAQVNSITGVKGNSESSYRTGNVNLTAANIGAADTNHTHSYAGSSSAGGAATSANKLNVGDSNIGSATQPVYFNASTGLPVATTYSLAKSVPADAKFTDTTYSNATTSKAGLMSSSDKTKLNGIATGANKIVYELKQINLGDLTWNQSSSGIYYSSKVSVSNISTILGVSIYDWGYLRATDVLTPTISDSNLNGISIIANTNSFANNAALYLLVFGIS